MSLLKKLRKKKHWTQRQLAEKSKLTTACICQIEKGKRIPSIKTLVKISEALEIDVSILINSIII
jgi:transcriptional regulator with XRE-family HTH domain